MEVVIVDPQHYVARTIPSGQQEKPASEPLLMEAGKVIELDPVRQENGEVEEAWAVEGDWHDIPSLKSLLYDDALFLKDKIKDMEKGAFFVVKEAFKKVLPHQYQLLKELKEILADRNSTKNI